jgi:nicotinate-nucleotide adenylyltransferase
MRVGFFGGSFDPPHQGHVAIARAARDRAGLDRVLFAPVGLQPLKPDGPVASFEDRVAMTRLAIKGQKGFEVSLVDAPSPGRPNYTIGTLELLREELGPETELFLVMGADSFHGLKRWRRAAEIPMLAGLIVASRPWEDLSQPGEWLPEGIRWEASKQERDLYALRDRKGKKGTLRILPDLRYEVSATELREAMRSKGESHLLNGTVLAYIRAHGLYA